MRLQYLPTIRHKYFDTIAHTCSFHAASAWPRATTRVLYCNAANAIFTWMPRVFGMPVALNVDGLERNRKKWNRAGEGLVSHLGMAGDLDAERRRDRRPARSPSIIASAIGRDSEMIPYGAEMGTVETTDVLRTLGLEPPQILSVRQPHGAGEQRAAGARGVRAACRHRSEAGADRRRSVRGRLHRARCATPRSAHRDPRRDLRRRAIASSARTASPTSTPPRSAARIRR